VFAAVLVPIFRRQKQYNDSNDIKEIEDDFFVADATVGEGGDEKNNFDSEKGATVGSTPSNH